MTETPRRVEPLPDPFVVGEDRLRTSALRGRLVFLLLPDTAGARALRDALGGLPGVTATGPPLRLFAQGLERLWADFQWVDHMGTATMLSASELLGALRRLADDLLSAVIGDARVLVEWSPEQAAAVPARVVATLYPDAHLLVGPGLAEHVAGAPNVLVVDPDELVREPAAFAHVVRDLGLEQRVARVEPPVRTGPRTELVVGSPLADRLVVVVGCGRSGTTWLEELFMAHPRVGGVEASETWLFVQLSPLWKNARSADGAGLSAYVGHDELATAIRRFCDEVFVRTLARHTPGADHFVEKSPMHSWRVPEIAAVYPDAWVVHLVRDGRDVARSISQVPFFELPDPGEAARVWREVVTTVRRHARGVPRYREVRYERLHADPVAEMRGLFGWVGLEVDAAVEAELRGRAERRVSMHAGGSQPVGPGSWRSLPAAAIADIYRNAGDVLVADGYATRTEVLRRRLAPAAWLGRLALRRPR